MNVQSVPQLVRAEGRVDGGTAKGVKVWAATWASPTPSSLMATSLTSSATHTHILCNVPHDRQKRQRRASRAQPMRAGSHRRHGLPGLSPPVHSHLVRAVRAARAALAPPRVAAAGTVSNSLSRGSTHRRYLPTPPPCTPPPATSAQA